MQCFYSLESNFRIFVISSKHLFQLRVKNIKINNLVHHAVIKVTPKAKNGKAIYFIDKLALQLPQPINHVWSLNWGKLQTAPWCIASAFEFADSPYRLVNNFAKLWEIAFVLRALNTSVHRRPSDAPWIRLKIHSRAYAIIGNSHNSDGSTSVALMIGQFSKIIYV